MASMSFALSKSSSPFGVSFRTLTYYRTISGLSIPFLSFATHFFEILKNYVANKTHICYTIHKYMERKWPELPENDLSQKIRDLRAKHNLTLEQIAQQVGVGKSTVRKWETGMIANMRRDKIAKLAVALHTTPGYLMGWEDSDETNAATEKLPANIIPMPEMRKIPLLAYKCAFARGCGCSRRYGHGYDGRPFNSSLQKI